MSAKVRLDGMDALVRELTAAPDDIRREAFDIVKEETIGAEQELIAALPTKSGTLRARVRSSFPSSTFIVGILQSASPHSHLWHWGTKTRQTASGANRGAMPAADPDPLVPIARKRRARMFRRLADMMRRRGYQVVER